MPGQPGAANAIAPGAVAVASAPPGVAPVLELNGTAALTIAGTATTMLRAGGETTVDPRSTFRVELPVALADARLSLLEGDAMVPSAGVREVGQATLLTLTPTSPLAAGVRLRLRVDGFATRELNARDGRRFAPLEWLVVVAGEVESRKAAGRRGKRR
jgi:hypothetical protein